MELSASRPVMIDLGPMAEAVEARVVSGEYDSASAVLIEGLRALEREEARYNATLKRKIEEALADPRPSIPQEQVFAELRARYESGQRPAAFAGCGLPIATSTRFSIG